MDDGMKEFLSGILKFGLILAAMPAFIVALSLFYMFIEAIAV